MRTKSRRDIRNQLFRISNSIGGDFGENPRLDRAWDIASRYENNIMRTQRFSKDAKEISTSIGQKRHENYERMDNRKYSRRTYMGLNAG